MDDIIGYLQSKEIEVKSGGAGEIRFSCPWCDDGDPGQKLYCHVGPDSSWGCFLCFRCGESGNYNKLRECFGDSRVGVDWDGIDIDVYQEIVNEAAKYYHEALSEQPDIYNYLREDRGLTFQTIQKFKLGWADGKLLPHLIQKGHDIEAVTKTGLVGEDGTDFLHNRITIPYLVMGQAAYIRGRRWPDGSSAIKYLQPSGVNLRPFNEDAIRNASKLIICEGEADCMILDQLGFAAISVPGAQTFKDEWVEMVKDVKRIHVMFDNDAPGRAGAEKLSAKLGDKARIVNLPEALPGQKKVDVTEYVVGWGRGKDDFDHLFSQASGGLLVSVRQAFERFEEVENDPGSKLKFNIDDLDNRMEHGLMPAQLCIVTAQTGSGKTRGSLNIFHRMSMIKPEIKILYVSLEQTRNEWFLISHRINKFYNPTATYLDTVDYWSDKLYLVDNNRLTHEQLQNAIQQYKYEMDDKLDLVCVDYLGYFAQSYPGNAIERTSAAVMDLKRIAKEEQIVMYAPTQIGRKGERGENHGAGMAADSAKVEMTADLEISFWNEDQKRDVNSDSDHTGLVGLRIEKTRQGGLHSVASLIYSPLSGALVPLTDSDPQWVLKVKREREMARAGVKYDEAMHMHETGDYSAFTGDLARFASISIAP